MSTEDPQVHEVAVLGAGIGGLGLAARLRREGEDDVVLLEKAERVGGTWRDNSYPGASCDVQSHLYWYSWDAPRDWTRVYAMQLEIQANVEEFAQRHGLLEKVRLGTEVVSAVWQDDVGHWLIRTADGAELRARSFVGAWGQLNRPTFRGINGRETFRGDSWHSARWRHDVDLRGKRVACIGNGASAVQFVPEVAEVAAHLTVFQKSPNYVVPRLDRFYEDEERRSFLDDPQAYLASRTGYYEEHESWMGAMKLESNPVLEEFYRVAREHLETQVPDPALREKLWPDYPLACKRILIADTYYPALVRDDVDLVTEQIARIEPEGVRTVDGTLHEVDVIVYATGFETLSFLGDLDVRGRGGRSLREAWQDGPEAYLGITVHGSRTSTCCTGPTQTSGTTRSLPCWSASTSTCCRPCAPPTRRAARRGGRRSTSARRCSAPTTSGCRRSCAGRPSPAAATAGTRPRTGGSPTTGPAASRTTRRAPHPSTCRITRC